MAIFPQIYKKPSLNRFYWCICYFGGILYTDKIAGKYKKIWFVYLLISALIAIISNFGYICTKDYIPIRDILYLSLPLNISVGYFFTIALLRFHINNLTKGMADLDNIFQRYSHLFQRKNEANIVRMEKYIAYITITFGCLGIWMIGILRVLLADEDMEMDLNDITLYLYPFPDSWQVTSVATYLVISVVQLLTALPGIVGLTISLEMCVIFASEIDDVMTGLQHYLNDQSKRTTEVIEANHHLELTTKSTTNTNSVRLAFVAQRKNMYRDFDQNIIYFIGIHQKVTKAISQFVPMFQHASAAWLIFLPPVIVSMGNDTLTAIKTEFGSDDVGRFAVGVAATVILYNVFSLARKIENACEKLQDEVYATPWYLLPKQCRQNIFILMNQVQKPITLIVGLTFKLEMPLLLEILNNCYSYIMFIQTIVDKFKLK